MKSGRRFGMLRKVCAVAVASVLAAGCLTACGSSKNTGPLTLDQIKENGKLTVATEAAYEPFEYMDGDKIIGYNADLFAKICDDLGVFVKRKGDDSIKSIEDMSGKKVGTQTSCYNEDDTKKFNEKLKSEGKDGYAELLKYDSFPEAFAELKNGKIDLVAQNYASCAAVVMKNPDDYEIVADDSGKAEMVGTDTWVSWAVRKEDTELSDYINSEIHKFKEDGTLAELQKKWFGEAVDLPESDYIPAE